MSNFEYRKHCCHKEREHDRNVKHRVRSPRRYVTQLSDREKLVENLSKLSLRQGAAVGSQRSCKASSSHCGAEARRQDEAKAHHRTAARTVATAAAASKEQSRGRSDFCYPVARATTSSARCKDDFVWQTGRYVKDECGSGIVPRRVDTADPRRLWCKTPLTMYQSTIGELARRMLCNEVVVPKRVNDAPPCNLCERVMPMCKGYYRKYECRRSCEEEHAVLKNGQKVYRDAIQQYWKPCLTTEERRAYDLSKDADHNVYLAKKLKRKIDERVACL